MDENALARVEHRRTELEANISKLRKSLNHWQTLEIDYEGLKEEFLGLPNDSSRSDIITVGRDFNAELVDEKELQSLLGQDKNTHRTPQQIVDLLSKRVEYVSRNASTLQKQLSDAEKKRNALLLAENPEYREDAGLPLAEITEELDEAGNVLSGKVETPGSAVPHLVDVLKKAGVDELVENDGIITTATQPRSALLKPTLGEEVAMSSRESPILEPRDATHSHANTDESPSEVLLSTGKRRPALQFLPKEKMPTTVNGEQRLVSPVSGQSAANRETIDEEDVISSHPDDTEEDAALRREMLQYGLNEIGPIVAELDLEDGSDVSYEDENDEEMDFESDMDEDEDDDVYEDESEDEYGRTKRPVISDRYHRKMKQLEKTLGIKDMSNLGPSPDLPPEIKSELDRPSAAEAARKAAIAREEAALKQSELKEASEQKAVQPAKKRKKVAFADSLDIASESQSTVPPTSTAKPKPNSQDPPPVLDSIVERGATTVEAKADPAAISTPKKPSRFKAARASTPQTPLFPPPQEDNPLKTSTKALPTGPSGMTIAKTIVERSTSENPSIHAPPDPDDVNDDLHRQEIAGDYYKLRNRMIHRQGGYVRGGEAENYGDEIASIPMEDVETGKPKKISRFKAARLR